MIRRRLAGFVRAGLILTALVASSSAVADGPLPPKNLCIQDSTGPSSCANVSSSVKWHPGHYIRVNQPTFPNDEAARRSWYDKIRNEPLIQGALILVPWGTVEPRQGVYDFSQIDKDLAYLKSMGKRLIIEPWWNNYWHGVPSVPQGGMGWLPDYIIANGCAAASTGQAGYTVRIHTQPCMDRLIALFEALAARYNGDPNVEQIIISEACVAYPDRNEQQFKDQTKRLITATAKAWPNTSRVFYMNWFWDPGEFMAYSAANGVGVGSPDTLPANISPVGEEHGALALRGAGDEYGTTDYRGRIPVSYSYEALHNITPAALYDYTVTTLKTTHMAWGAAEHLSAEMNWSTGVLPTIKAKAGRMGTTACPSAYVCNTQ